MRALAQVAQRRGISKAVLFFNNWASYLAVEVKPGPVHLLWPLNGLMLQEAGRSSIVPASSDGGQGASNALANSRLSRSVALFSCCGQQGGRHAATLNL